MPAPARIRVPKFKNLTVDGNPKVAKGEKLGVLTGVLHLLPATSYDALRVKNGLPALGVNLCPFAGSCAAPCLVSAGRGGIPMARYAGTVFSNNVEAGRYRKTDEYYMQRASFLAQLVRDMTKLASVAAKHGMRAAVRLNGTSDLDWSRRHPEVIAAARALDITLYDYTKRPIKYRADSPVHLTYSYDVGRDAQAMAYLQAGGNVAVVFKTAKGRDLPATWNGYPVIDGDVTDVRFLDGSGVVVGLRAKGKAKSDTSGFVQPHAAT